MKDLPPLSKISPRMLKVSLLSALHETQQLTNCNVCSTTSGKTVCWRKTFRSCEARVNSHALGRATPPRSCEATLCQKWLSEPVSLLVGLLHELLTRSSKLSWGNTWICGCVRWIPWTFCFFEIALLGGILQTLNTVFAVEARLWGFRLPENKLWLHWSHEMVGF